MFYRDRACAERCSTRCASPICASRTATADVVAKLRARRTRQTSTLSRASSRGCLGKAPQSALTSRAHGASRLHTAQPAAGRSHTSPEVAARSSFQLERWTQYQTYCLEPTSSGGPGHRGRVAEKGFPVTRNTRRIGGRNAWYQAPLHDSPAGVPVEQSVMNAPTRRARW